MAPANRPGILVAGIGNTLHGDDGIAAWVCTVLARENWPHVETVCMEELDYSLLEYLFHKDLVILVEAGLHKEPVRFHDIQSGFRRNVSDEFGDDYLLPSLMNSIKTQSIKWMLCTIRAQAFEYGSDISSATRKNGAMALDILRQYVQTLKQTQWNP